jgi:3-oxoacyl-[acyl-carrier-protein] synthase-3
MGIRIAAVGSYVPSRVVTNRELAGRMDTSHEWIVSKTGIFERRIADPSEAPSDMACEAARRCLNSAAIDGSAVDLIVVACATPDQSQPAVACLVQEKLGIAANQCPAFDVNSVCAGFVFALIENYGNMAAASIPVTLDAARVQGRLPPGSRVVLCGFGGGLSWGAALLNW